MNSILRVAAVVVLIGMVAALPGMQAFAASPSLPSEGCHSHSRAPMSPVRYQCCANGHNWAIAGSPVAVHALVVMDLHIVPDFNISGSTQSVTVNSLSSSPPLRSPLRI